MENVPYTKEKVNSEQQTLSRTLAFLTNISLTCVSLSVSEIADELKVSKPTAYTIVNSLVSQGYLEKEPETGKFHIGFRFYVQGQNYPRLYPFLIYADDYAQSLHSRLGLRINISVFKAPMAALVVASKDVSIVPRHSGGYLMPAHLSASGKLMLSALPRETAKDYIMSADLFPLTDKSITDPVKLMEEIDKVRELGYSIDDEEFVPGSVCAAAPIYNAAGHQLCTISAAKCSASRFAQDKELILRELKSAAVKVSIDLGYSRESHLKFTY